MEEYLLMKNLCFDPLTKQEHIGPLISLSEIVRTCIGRRGKLKLIRNSSGGQTIVTSSSCRIFHSLSVRNSFNKMIVSAVKSHLRTYKDGGLLCALFPLLLIEHSSLCDIPTSLKSNLYERFLHVYINCLSSTEENGCVWNMDPASLQHLRSVTQTLISSKVECLLSSSQRRHVCALLLETFLNTSENPSSFRLVTISGRDTMESRLLKGLLLKIPKIEWVLFPYHKKSVKVTLFASSFSVSTNTISRLILSKVDVVFCQTVVDPPLKKQLNDAGITVLDQLGLESTGCLRYMLDDWVNLSEKNLFFNTLECFKEEDGLYIVLQRKQLNFCSILISHYNQEFLSELKVVCEQVMTTLFRLLKCTKVCFGGGCTEICTAILFAHQIKNELLQDMASEFGCSDDKILSLLNCFLLSLTALAVSPHQDSPLNFMIDGKYGHLWNTSSSTLPETCCCGHCKSSNIESHRWHALSHVMQIPMPTSSNPAESCLVDDLNCKVNAIATGGDAAISLLKTRLCILTGAQSIC